MSWVQSKNGEALWVMVQYESIPGKYTWVMSLFWVNSWKFPWVLSWIDSSLRDTAWVMSWFESRHFVECPKKSAKFSGSPKRWTKLSENTKKGKRHWVKAEKRSTKSTVESNHWVMIWFKSIFQIFLFMSWFGRKKNPGKLFESWIDLNQNIIYTSWVVSRFESIFRNPFWVVSWFESIPVKPLWVMSWVESKPSETKCIPIKNILSRTHVWYNIP